jgi:uncharacterized membrane protein YeaQ/YmgE (transglycosylase-associated protein family)
MIGFLLTLVLVGLIAGFIARALVPGRDPMTVGQTILLGIAGSFIGGFIGYAVFGTDAAEGALQTSGLVGSVAGAVIALLVFRRTSGRSRLGFR